MTRLSLAVGLLLAATVHADDQPIAHIAGTVSDGAQRPVANAAVMLADHETGLPIDAETRDVYRLTDRGHPMVWTKTDADGRFQFTDLLPGRYRVWAQAWEDREDFESPVEVNGPFVQLLGSANNLVVPSDGAGDVALQPAGQGVVAFTSPDIGNSECFLLLSTEPPQDPVLGPLGWIGSFLGRQVGFNRMPYGYTVVRGLPDGDFGAAFFAADNSPGFGAVRGTINFKRRPVSTIVVSETDMIAGWSNARRTPWPNLAPLVAEVQPIWDGPNREILWQALTKETDLADQSDESLDSLNDFALFVPLVKQLGPWDRKVSLPSGTTCSVGDLLAAIGYARIKPKNE